MVSFVCDKCNHVMRKPQVAQHFTRCDSPSISCLDCHTTFWDNAYEAHTQCISEAEKYQGHLYKGKRNGQEQNQEQNQEKKQDQGLKRKFADREEKETKQEKKKRVKQERKEKRKKRRRSKGKEI